MAMSGSLKLLGLTAGFFGMMLGWSLQQPVTGIAAWLMIILKKPFKIGDRVIIAGITGDVTGISLTHVILNQVGGSVGGEERSGRGILIPNAILFQHVIINYTLDQEFMLDEVPVRLTFDSDWERAKEIMIAAAKEVTQDIIDEDGRGAVHPRGVPGLGHPGAPALQHDSGQAAGTLHLHHRDPSARVRQGVPARAVRRPVPEHPLPPRCWCVRTSG